MFNIQKTIVEKKLKIERAKGEEKSRKFYLRN